MQNTLGDLNNHLFAEIERLGDEDLKGEELEKEIMRAEAVTKVSSQIIANGVDERCVWMTFIQCSLYGVPAIVSQQNTLTMETYGAPWMTPVYIWEGWPWRRQHKQELMEAEA